VGDWVFKSKDIKVKDATQQLLGIESAKGEASRTSIIEAINQITNLQLEPGEEGNMSGAQPGRGPEQNDNALQGTPVPTPARKSEPVGLKVLAEDANALMKSGIKTEEDADRWARLFEDIQSLSPLEKRTFKSMLALESFEVWEHDPDGAVELANCALEVAQRRAVNGSGAVLNVDS
jgi:hypothetical protein